MDSTDRILSVVLAVVIVASTVMMPLVAMPTAAAQSNTTQDQQNYDFNTNNSNTTQESSTSDTSTSDESETDSSTQELEIDETGLQDDYSIQRGMSDLNIQDMKVQNWNGVAGGATVEAFISADVPPAHYPFKYPVSVTVEALEGGEVVATQKTQVVLRPHTKSTDWSNVTFNNLDKSDLKSYSAYASTNFTFDQANSSQYTFRVRTQSKYNSALVKQSQTNFTVDGQNTENIANIDAVIQTANDYRELPTKSRPNSFKSSTTSPSYMEDISLPTRRMVEPVGTISQFANMTVPNKKSAVISSEGGQLRVTTATEYIEPNTPQTLVIRYAMTGESDSMVVEPISAGGDEIDPDTTYELKRGSQDECIEGDVTSACIITLSEDERNYINQHGELFLSFESSESTQAQLLCQSVIGGGLDTADSNVCGIKSLSDGAKPVYKPTITDFSIVPSGETNLLDEGSQIEMDGREPGDFQVGIVVKNTGTAPLQGDEPVQVFQNSTFSTPSKETITKTSGTDYNSNLDNQTVTHNFSQRYPASNIDYRIDADTNGGVIELKIEDDQGDSIYRTYRNVDGVQEIGLSGLGGYTGSLTVTVNGIYNDSSDQPTVSSMEAIAVDQSSTAKTEVQLNDFSGGSGPLAPGDTRKHVFPVSEIDLSSVVDPAVTLKSEFGDDTEELEISKSGADGDPKLVADAGGPYNARLEVDQWTREQTGYGTIIANVQPGPEWESDGTYDGTVSDKMTYTTTHKDVPKVNLSTQNAIQYYKDNGYIRELEKQLPEYYSGMDIKEIRYTNYTGDEMFFGTEKEINNASSLTYQEGNWTSGSFVGEDIQGYDKVRATMFRNSNGDLDFKTDNSEAIYFYGSGASQLVVEVTETIEQQEKPNIGQDAPKCGNTNEYPCWQKGRYIGTERTTEGYTDRICQDWTNYQDPGPDWYLADSSGFTQVCWEKINVTNKYDQYRWQLLDEVEEVALHIPQYEPYDQHSRPVYDMEIVWERDRAETATQYIWTGPEYTVEPDTSPSTVRFDGSGSQSKSNVPIENYQWYLDGEEISTSSLGSPTTEIEELGRHEVKLVVSGGGLSDTDTTHIDTTATCGELNVCTGSDHPTLSVGKVTEKVDSKYQEAAIEVDLSETPNNGSRYQYKLAVTPAESAISVTNGDNCPTGYNTNTYTLPNDKDQLTSDSLLPLILDNIDSGNTKTVGVCEKTDEGPDSGPLLFIHPNSIDDSIDGGARTFQLDEDTQKTFWKGAGIPEGGLTQLAYINPRFSPDINNGYQEFTIKLQVKDNKSTSPSYNTVDKATTTVEFCRANSVWECEDLNSDLDDKVDGDDQCPYVIARTQFPCEGYPEPDEDEQALVFGSQSEGWQIDTETNYNPLSTNNGTTDEAYMGTQPSHAVADGNTIGSGTPYDPETLEMFYDGQVVTNNSNLETIAQYPLDYSASGSLDSYKKSWTLREAINANNSQAFTGQFKRDYQQERYIATFTPPKQDGYRDHLTNITGWNSETWSGGENSAYFTKSYIDYTSYYNVQLRVDSGDRGGGYWFDLEKKVDAIFYSETGGGKEQVDYYESQYGSDWEKEYKYTIIKYIDGSLQSGITESPTGRAYALDPSEDELGNNSKYAYFSIANHAGWPGQASPQDPLYPTAGFSATTHNLHEQMSNIGGDGYDLSFWYKPTLGTTDETRYVVKRRVTPTEAANTPRREDQPVIVYVTEQDFVETNIDPGTEIKEDELHLGSYLHMTPSSYDEMDKDFIETNRTTMTSASEGDEIKYVLWKDKSSDQMAAIQVWNADNGPTNVGGYIPQDVSESDYFVEEYNPMVGEQRKIVAQATHKKADVLYELSYIRPANIWETGPASDGRQEYIDYNYGSQRLGNIVESDLPFLQLKTKNDTSVIRPYSPDGWKHATLAMDRADNTVTYYENYDDSQVSVNVRDNLNNNIQSNNKLQLFMGGGWATPDQFGILRKWGGKFSGQYSDVRVTKSISDRDAAVNSYYPEQAMVKTMNKSVPQEDIDRALNPDNSVEMNDVTFTDDNTRISPIINWKKDGIEGRAVVKITADPENTQSSGTPPEQEKYTETYYYNPSTGSSFSLVENDLADGKNYTEFNVRVTIKTRDSDNWKAPEIKRVDLLNYNPNIPDVPPSPVDGTVQTSGNNRNVPAPATDADGNTTDSGGSVNLSGQIRYEGGSDTVPVKFIVRDNNTVIAEGTIATDDGLIKTQEVGWNQLKDAGLEPREDAYLVEFVVEEDPDGLWPRRSLGIGRFIMCDKDGTIC